MPAFNRRAAGDPRTSGRDSDRARELFAPPRHSPGRGNRWAELADGTIALFERVVGSSRTGQAARQRCWRGLVNGERVALRQTKYGCACRSKWAKGYAILAKRFCRFQI